MNAWSKDPALIVVSAAMHGSGPDGVRVASAAVHGAGPDGPKVFATMLDALEKIEPEQAQGYIDEVLAVLPKAARRILEAMVKTRDREYKSDFARGYFREGEAKGEAKGEARLILAVLAARGDRRVRAGTHAACRV